MTQLDFWLEEPHANHSQLLDSEKDSKTQEETLPLPMLEFLTSLDPSGSYGKTCRVSSVQAVEGILVPFSERWPNAGMGSHIGCLTLNTLEYHKDVEESLLSDILETGDLPQKYYLSPRACQGILNRAERRGKVLPAMLKAALDNIVKMSLPEQPKQVEES